MKSGINLNIQSLIISIENIGNSKPELEFKKKKILEDLKKSKSDLLQEAFSDAFNPKKSKQNGDDMNLVIAILALLICFFFSYNFGKILNKIKKGRDTNKYSLFATSSLIIHFICLFFYFIFGIEIVVLISEIYMLMCLVFVLKKN